MSVKICSYYSPVGDLKKLLDDIATMKKLDRDKNRKGLPFDQLLKSSVIYIGIPHETYPTRIDVDTFNLKDVPDEVSVRIETTTEQLEEIIKITKSELALKDTKDQSGDLLAEILKILEKILSERYYDKTHQVPSFDTMAQRLTY